MFTPPNAGGTYGARLRQYQRRSAIITWVGAGLAGLVLLVTSSLADGAPHVLGASSASLIVLGGGAFAIARIKFEWAATVLEREIADANAKARKDAADAAGKKGKAANKAVAAAEAAAIRQSKADANIPVGGGTYPWPKFGEFAYRAEVLLVPTAALVYLASVWWAVYG